MLAELRWVCSCMFGLGCCLAFFAAGTATSVLNISPKDPMLVTSALITLYALLYIYAALMLQRFEHEKLVAVAVFLSPLGICTILGAPVALAVLILGSRLLSEPRIQQAFADVRRGVPLAEVRKALGIKRFYNDERDDYDDDALR